jgi:hypothetical protein
MNDAALWHAFTTATLPEAAWTHQAHLRVAWMHSARFSSDEAHVLMRVGIIRLNASHGLVETAQRGYHETITRAWLAVVRAQRKAVLAPTSDVFLEACGEIVERSALLRYYSRERLMSLPARARFLDPDLMPLPGDPAKP